MEGLFFLCSTCHTYWRCAILHCSIPIHLAKWNESTKRWQLSVASLTRTKRRSHWTSSTRRHHCSRSTTDTQSILLHLLRHSRYSSVCCTAYAIDPWKELTLCCVDPRLLSCRHPFHSMDWSYPDTKRTQETVLIETIIDPSVIVLEFVDE